MLAVKKPFKESSGLVDRETLKIPLIIILWLKSDKEIKIPLEKMLGWSESLQFTCWNIMGKAVIILIVIFLFFIFTLFPFSFQHYKIYVHLYTTVHLFIEKNETL